MNNNVKVLITRPEKPGKLLTQKLNKAGIYSFSQPMFDYQVYSNLNEVNSLLGTLNNPIIIFVSVAAVEYAQQILPLSQWQYTHVISVGRATQQALQQLNISSDCPKNQASEGMLNLPVLNKINNKDILIVRGNGGREHLAEQLHERGANVAYLESYQRIWREVGNKQISLWQAKELNCIVATSNAILEKIVSLLSNTDKTLVNRYLWIVASKRIAENAKALGATNVINANGASDDNILSALTSAQANSKTNK